MRLVILGAGESGTGAAVLAKKQGFDVFVSDLSAIQDNYKEILNKYEIPFEEKQHTNELILNANEIIKSPGIPDKAPIIQELIKKEIPIISEIEFAGRYTNAKTICITGSNGKTTTTSLIYFMLQNAGYNVGLAGNIGKSFALQVAEDNFDYYVIELSSFQLDGMYKFRADFAILTNITPDHLDRYHYNFQEYIDSKFRIIQNMTPNDYFIYCSDDPVILKEIEIRQNIGIKLPQLLPFSIKDKLIEGGHIEEDTMLIKINNEEMSMLLTELSLTGKHNTYNSMAAAITGKASGITNPVIRKSMMDFTGVEHRLEPVCMVRGVQYINDSKATNVNSTWYALESLKTKTVWIVGGVDKGNDYSELYELVKEKVKVIVCLGTDNSKIVKSFENRGLEIIETNSMEHAVKACYYLAEPGETVLLSPACASFDLFKNYEDRGRKFKKAVREL